MKKSSPTSTAAGPAAAEPLLLVRESQAVKLGVRSTGLITYQVLTNIERSHIFVRIAKNDGGGYFSDEAVPLANLRSCIDNHPRDKPLRAGAFKAAFAGRSSNNPSFAAAVLLAEHLAQRDPVSPGVLLATQDWEAWTTEQVALAQGELDPVSVSKPSKWLRAAGASNVDECLHSPDLSPELQQSQTSNLGEPAAGEDEPSPVQEPLTTPRRHGRGAILKRDRKPR